MLWDQIKVDLERYRSRGDIVPDFVGRKVPIEESLEATLLKLVCLELCDEKWIGFDVLYPHLRSTYLPSGMDVVALEKDLLAFKERDPACRGFVEVLLFYKGFFALQSYRIAHWHWKTGRKELARILQKRVSDLFSIDIHPGATIASGIFIDHGTGIVIGETAVVSADVSILHGVTLGGTGNHSGDRHPKVGQGVLIGANSIVLGNISIGAHSKIGAGSVVLESVPMRCTVAGVPARIVRRGTPLLPSHGMSQKPQDFEGSSTMDNAELKTKFGQGRTWDEFYQRSEASRIGLDQVFNALERDEEFLEILQGKSPLNVFVAGETWCPDVIHHFPLMARLGQWVPGVNVRFFDSKEESELLSYLNQGKSKTIPTILFCDADFNEIGIVKGRQPKARAWMKERVAGRAPSDIPPDEVTVLISDFNENFCKDFVRETYAQMQSRLHQVCLL